MPRHEDVTSFLQQSASPFDHRAVSKFLKIRPKILGVLEISISIAMLILTIWTGFLYLLWSCLISILTGSVTVSAACTRNTCWVRISQFLNCFNAIAAAVSIPFHCLDSDGVTLILLVFCDVLVFIISVIVASSSCDCCRMKSRHVAVSYINRDVPYRTDNNIGLQGQQGPFAPPPNYDPSPLEPPPKYDLYRSAPLANYNPSPLATPPNDDPSFFCTFTKMQSFLQPLWAAMVLVACDILICILSAIVSSTTNCRCCDCCRSSETTYPEQRVARRQNDIQFYDRARSTVIVPDFAALPTVYNSVRYVLSSEHGPARL
ncbi:uncharacterized protein LOC107714311 [Sinocyclocheilus rhinocerous]|uniref:uncharacterized protein LOC107714311 n=1 Tax=Sinocyclocheilus rhinocerous TaxID=307959 RepID=UPI0007B7AC5E|nr:PREDICTED: uncharacterized protein LOC107714311 [Sinocyclocheilus rhinocerous]